MSQLSIHDIDSIFMEFVGLAREANALPTTSHLDRDYSLHICGVAAYPATMEPALTMETYHHVDWMPHQIQAVKEFVATEINISDEIALDIKELGGLWPTLLKNQSYFADFYGQGLRNWVPLEVEIAGISLKIEKLIDETDLKNMVYKVDDEDKALHKNLAKHLVEYNQHHGLQSDEADDTVNFLLNYERPEIKRHDITDFVYFQVLREILSRYGACKHFEETPCIACGGMFYPQTIANSIRVMGSSFCAGCISLATDDVGLYSKVYKGKVAQREFAIYGIQAFVELAGFLPGAAIKPGKLLSKSTIRHLPKEEARDLAKAWALVPRPRAVKELFPSWAHLLDAAGLLEGDYNPNSRGRRSISSCKHLCLSLGERYICEFLNNKKMKHTREPAYPHHEQLNPNGKLRADFLIGDLWVEFAGLKGQPAYDSRMKNKVKLGKALDLNLLVIEPKDLVSLEKMFAAPN
jgi:hypothetical protein